MNSLRGGIQIELFPFYSVENAFRIEPLAIAQIGFFESYVVFFLDFFTILLLPQVFQQSLILEQLPIPRHAGGQGYEKKTQPPDPIVVTYKLYAVDPPPSLQNSRGPCPAMQLPTYSLTQRNNRVKQMVGYHAQESPVLPGQDVQVDGEVDCVGEEDGHGNHGQHGS